MDKPLKDWTLGEVKEYCENRDWCEGCEFEDGIGGPCMFEYLPANFDLSESSRWSEDEIALAKLLIKAGFKCVTCFGEANINLNDGEKGWFIPKALFPSLHSNESAKLAEIVEGSEHDD